jgi:hypothetical protein
MLDMKWPIVISNGWGFVGESPEEEKSQKWMVRGSAVLLHWRQPPAFQVPLASTLRVAVLCLAATAEPTGSKTGIVLCKREEGPTGFCGGLVAPQRHG